ncbi:H-NS family nucleoid-associated regulatory protein [Enterobacter cloacae]|uniref:H-NS histone family protein n=1 Tax=Enterobacter cloacae TaxID=550 RepID=UPI002FF72B8B
MNHIQQELTNTRTLNRFLRECDYTFLTMLHDRITSALEGKKAAHLEEEKERKLREEKRAALIEMIKSEGFAPEELLGFVQENKTGKRAAKYQYEENGTLKKWSGVGRTPVVIQQAIDEGKTLNDFLIEAKRDE